MFKDITNVILTSRQKKPIDETKYKTEMCRNWVELNYCQYGEKCNFAHGKDELVNKVPTNTKYKSKKCMPFHTKGYCTYGHRCLFVHDNRKLEDISKKYLKQLCHSKRLSVFKEICPDQEHDLNDLETKIIKNLESIISGELQVTWSSPSCKK